MLIRLCKYVPCSKHSIVFLCYFVHIRCIFRKISSLQADEYKTKWRPFRTAWVRSANQITRLDNKEIQNINKRPQWVLDEGRPLKSCDSRANVSTSCVVSSAGVIFILHLASNYDLVKLVALWTVINNQIQICLETPRQQSRSLTLKANHQGWSKVVMRLLLYTQ